MTGAATDTSAPPPNNALGGILGVQGSATGTYGMTGNVVCSGSIPWKIALAVDTVMDDGNSDTGTVRGGLTSAAANDPTTSGISHSYGVNPAPADTDATLTLCMRI